MTGARTACVVGSGGREHALARALARSARVVVTPGNPGMSDPAAGISVSAADVGDIAADLYVIGPEAPLVDGLADRLRAGGRLVLGPGADGARLEGSKAFMKELLAEAAIPTARFSVFDDAERALRFLRGLEPPWVVKTDGLASGKGVLVTSSLAEAEEDVRNKLAGSTFGDAGRRIVIEEGLQGTECSLLVLCDGTRVAALSSAQDFKRVGDDDAGPNTGGMGAYSPVPGLDEPTVDELVAVTVEPLVAALRRRGVDYRGVLYAGLMLTDDGPRVLEFNVRFGDPETQVVLPRLETDLFDLLSEAAAGSLRSGVRWRSDSAVCVVMAAAGYPERPRTGDPITGIEAANERPGVFVYQAGTALGEHGSLVTAGGRVLGVTATGPTLADARQRAYDAVSLISWPGAHYRGDIARRAADGQRTAPGPAPVRG